MYFHNDTLPEDFKFKEEIKNIHKMFFFFVTIVHFRVHIWDKDDKCITMSTNKPMFGPVVLDILAFFILHKVCSTAYLCSLPT